MDCPGCGNEINERAAFCTQCGVALPKRGSAAKEVLKWVGIGCGGLLGLFVVLVIIAALTAETPSRDEQIARPRALATATPLSALQIGEAQSLSETRQTPTPDPSAWDGASRRCDAPTMAKWSDETWQDTAVRYLGATILLGISGTQWSLSPRELRDYGDFLNGTYRPTTGEWSSLLNTHREFSSTLMSGTMVTGSGPKIGGWSTTLMVDSFRSDFPSSWLATYHSLLPALVEISLPDGRLTGVIAIPQGAEGNPVRDSLGIFRNQFDCRTAELRG